MKLRVIPLLFAVVVLGGCSPQVEPAPSPSSTVEAEPTTSPTPTPTPTPEPDPSDPAHWIIGFDSVGPLALGQPIDEARAALVGYTEEEAVPDCRVAFLNRAGYPSLAVSYWDGGLLGYIYVRNQEGVTGMTATEIKPFSPATAEGIRIGSSRDDVLAAYPDAAELRNGTAFAVSGAAGFIIVSVTEDGIVDSIMVNTTGGIANELC